MESLHQVFKLNLCSDRHTVTNDVQVVFLEIYDFLASAVLDPRVANVPLRGNLPVEYLLKRSLLFDLKWNYFLKYS